MTFSSVWSEAKGWNWGLIIILAATLVVDYILLCWIVALCRFFLT